jgi:trans-aconitate methyltransferase
MRKLFILCFFSFSFVYSLFLSAEEPQDHWKGSEYAKNSESQKASAEDFMQLVHFKGTEVILDVGCGDGKITAAMAKKVPQGSVVGIDISSSMIQVVQNAFPHQTNLKFYVQDAANVHDEQQFDLITSFTVMQWVLEQQAALQCFEKALKPGGKLWIQMPTGLPKAMQCALEKTMSSPRWKSYFTDFSPPWRFYSSEEYRTLLSHTHFTSLHLEVTTKHEQFPSRAAFHGFLKQWFPYLRPLPADQKEAFLTALLDNYLILLPADEHGRVSFIVDRLEVQAKKK